MALPEGVHSIINIGRCPEGTDEKEWSAWLKFGMMLLEDPPESFIRTEWIKPSAEIARTKEDFAGETEMVLWCTTESCCIGGITPELARQAQDMKWKANPLLVSIAMTMGRHITKNFVSKYEVQAALDLLLKAMPVLAEK